MNTLHHENVKIDTEIVTSDEKIQAEKKHRWRLSIRFSLVNMLSLVEIK